MACARASSQIHDLRTPSCQVSCQECWEDCRRTRASAAPPADSDRLLTSAPRDVSGHLRGQQPETTTVALGIASPTVDPITHREVPQGQWTQHDPEWVVDGVVVSPEERGLGRLDGQPGVAATTTVATVAAIHRPPARELRPARPGAESTHQFSSAS